MTVAHDHTAFKNIGTLIFTIGLLCDIRSIAPEMATANVTGLERTASLALSSRSIDSPNASGDVKTAAVTKIGERNDSHSQKPTDIESINSHQPAGLKQMEAITLTWSKKWLITAYCL